MGAELERTVGLLNQSQRWLCRWCPRQRIVGCYKWKGEERKEAIRISAVGFHHHRT